MLLTIIAAPLILTGFQLIWLVVPTPQRFRRRREEQRERNHYAEL